MKTSAIKAFVFTAALLAVTLLLSAINTVHDVFNFLLTTILFPGFVVISFFVPLWTVAHDTEFSLIVVINMLMYLGLAFLFFKSKSKRESGSINARDLE